MSKRYNGYRETTGKDSIAAAANMDMRWHDLVVLVGAPCRICERGTCPGTIASSAVETLAVGT